MLKLVLFIFLAIITKGYFQDLHGNLQPNYSDGSPGNNLQIDFGEPRVRSKPCPYRRHSLESNRLRPLFQPKSRIVYPVHNNRILEPQALKNENIQDKYDGFSVPPRFLHEPKNSAADNGNENEFNQPITLPLTPNRRSNNNEELAKDNDCDKHLDSYNNPDSYLKNLELAGNTRRSNDIEQQLVDIINECINKKKKLLGEDTGPIGRRSLNTSTDSLHDDDLDLNSNNAGSNEDALLNNGEYSDEAPFKIEKVDISLQPGKLYNNLQNPTISSAIADLPPSRRMAESSRVCYACSSATNPSCWQPDSRTTVKYCQSEQSCLTKTFGGANDSVTLIRDCANNCDSVSVSGIEPKYKNCKLCHTDLCNSAIANTYSLVLVFLIAMICTF